MAVWITRVGVRYANEVAVEQMIAAAVQAEREACAKLADRHAEDAEHITQAENTAILIAVDIRARR